MCVCGVCVRVCVCGCVCLCVCVCTLHIQVLCDTVPVKKVSDLYAPMLEYDSSSSSFSNERLLLPSFDPMPSCRVRWCLTCCYVLRTVDVSFVCVCVCLFCMTCMCVCVCVFVFYLCVCVFVFACVFVVNLRVCVFVLYLCVCICYAL